MNSTLCKNIGNYTERNKQPRNPPLCPTLPKPHYPSPRTTFLPPLSKGGGLTARRKLLLCCIFTCDTSAFLFAKLFCRQDGGIALHHQPFQNRTIPRLAPPLPFNKRSACFAFAILATIRPAPTLPKPHYPLKSTVFLPPLSKVRCCRPKKIRATTGGIVTPPPFPKPHYPTKTAITLAFK